MNSEGFTVDHLVSFFYEPHQGQKTHKNLLIKPKSVTEEKDKGDKVKCLDISQINVHVCL